VTSNRNSLVRATRIYFTDFFGVDPAVLDSYGAFNVSLINDLPLFIDPFLLFDSEDEQYKALHEDIIRYVKFLRDVSASDQAISRGLRDHWFQSKNSSPLLFQRLAERRALRGKFGMTGNRGASRRLSVDRSRTSLAPPTERRSAPHHAWQ